MAQPDRSVHSGDCKLGITFERHYLCSICGWEVTESQTIVEKGFRRCIDCYDGPGPNDGFHRPGAEFKG